MIYIYIICVYIYIIYVLDCVMTFIGHTFADLGSMWLVIWRIPPCFFSPIPQVDPTDLPPIRSNEKCLDRSPPFPYGCFLKGAIGGRDSSVGFSNEVITPMDLGASKKIDDAMVLFINRLDGARCVKARYEYIWWYHNYVYVYTCVCTQCININIHYVYI